MEKLNKIYRTSDVPLIDKYTIDNEKIESFELMERAATAWTDFFVGMSEKTRHIVVIAGQGNNGGDGYAIARLLVGRGMNAEVVRLPSGHSYSVDCKRNLDLWEAQRGKLTVVEHPEEWIPDRDAVIVDALFGSGLNRPVQGIAAAMIRRINDLPNAVYSVDIPSGLMGEDNTANDCTAIIKADYTFTFQFPKLAFLLPDTAGYAGKWFVLDIGLHTAGVKALAECTTLSTVQKSLPFPGKFDHKGTNGRALLIAGKRGMMGAAVLAAKGALHSGVGVLHAHVPAGCSDILQVTVPETVLDMDESENSFTDVANLGKYSAIAVGPGIGQQSSTVKALEKLLHAWRGKTILDADALNIMALHPELLKLLHEDCLLTPHPKEFERLVGKCANDFVRLNKLITFAKQYKVHVILKGAYSVVATPAGELCFNTSGNPGMAKGGSGDVLTGVLLALAAGKTDMLDVARIGAFVHGLSADILAEEHGCRGIVSGMIAEGMGRAWKKIENRKNR